MATANKNLDGTQGEAHDETDSLRSDYVINNSMSDPAADQIATLTEGSTPEVKDEHGERGIVAEGNKKKALLAEAQVVEEAAPPPYTPATAKAAEKPFWKKRWFLLTAIGVLALLVILVAVLLGVLLSRNHANKSSNSRYARDPRRRVLTVNH